MLIDGVFYAANQLYGLTFKERNGHSDLEPDMRVFEVFDQDGKQLALFYVDPWKRDNKQGGAWMSNLVNQSYLRGTKPVVFNVAELHQARSGPADADQLRRCDDDVPRIRPRASWHVRGADLSDACRAPTWRATSSSSRRSSTRIGRSIPRCSPHYAVNYQTGQPMPQDLVDKIKRSRDLQPGL